MRKILLCALLFLAVITLQPVHASPNAVIQNDSSYVDAAGYLHVVGEVLNTGDTWLQFIQVTGTLKSSTGQVVDVVMTYTLLGWLPPNARAPFDLIEADTAKSSALPATLSP